MRKKGFTAMLNAMKSYRPSKKNAKPIDQALHSIQKAFNSYDEKGQMYQVVYDAESSTYMTKQIKKAR